MPRLSMAPANSTTAMPRMEPTDRSMPRVRITNVMPVARMPTIETWRSTFKRLGTVRNRGDRKEAAITSRINAAKTPTRCQPRVMVARWLPRADGEDASGCGKSGCFHDGAFGRFGAGQRGRDASAP